MPSVLPNILESEFGEGGIEERAPVDHHPLMDPFDRHSVVIPATLGQ